MVPGDRTRGKGYIHRRLPLNLKKYIFTVRVTEQWNGLFIEQDLIQLTVITNRILQNSHIRKPKSLPQVQFKKN